MPAQPLVANKMATPGSVAKCAKLIKHYITCNTHTQIECWRGEELVGGLYGISVNSLFFGESMFSRANDASKVALYYLCQFLANENVPWIDCQVESSHLLSLGAQHITREKFINEIEESLNKTSPVQWHRFAESIE